MVIEFFLGRAIIEPDSSWWRPCVSCSECEGDDIGDGVRFNMRIFSSLCFLEREEDGDSGCGVRFSLSLELLCLNWSSTLKPLRIFFVMDPERERDGGGENWSSAIWSICGPLSSSLIFLATDELFSADSVVLADDWCIGLFSKAVMRLFLWLDPLSIGILECVNSCSIILFICISKVICFRFESIFCDGFFVDVWLVALIFAVWASKSLKLLRLLITVLSRK